MSVSFAQMLGWMRLGDFRLRKALGWNVADVPRPKSIEAKLATAPYVLGDRDLPAIHTALDSKDLNKLADALFTCDLQRLPPFFRPLRLARLLRTKQFSEAAAAVDAAGLQQWEAALQASSARALGAVLCEHHRAHEGNPRFHRDNFRNLPDKMMKDLVEDLQARAEQARPVSSDAECVAVIEGIRNLDRRALQQALAERSQAIFLAILESALPQIQSNELTSTDTYQSCAKTVWARTSDGWGYPDLYVQDIKQLRAFLVAIRQRKRKAYAIDQLPQLPQLPAAPVEAPDGTRGDFVVADGDGNDFEYVWIRAEEYRSTWLDLRAHFNQLNPKQRLVADGVSLGKTATEMAAEIDMTERTIARLWNQVAVFFLRHQSSNHGAFWESLTAIERTAVSGILADEDGVPEQDTKLWIEVKAELRVWIHSGRLIDEAGGPGNLLIPNL